MHTFQAIFDGDGDIDLAVRSRAKGAQKTEVFINVDGAGDLQFLAALDDQLITIADMNSDGLLDLIGNHSWYAASPQLNFDALSWPAPWLEVFNSSTILNFSPLLPIDVDSDGDNDLLESLNGNELKWHENADGLGQLGLQQPLLDGDQQFTVQSDVDMDGDNDIITTGIGSGVVWLENRLAGDVNDDGIVEFDDFLALAANFGKSEDVVWADGDFDGNGLVAFADFLALSENFGAKRRAM